MRVEGRRSAGLFASAAREVNRKILENRVEKRYMFLRRMGEQLVAAGQEARVRGRRRGLGAGRRRRR